MVLDWKKIGLFGAAGAILVAGYMFVTSAPEAPPLPPPRPPVVVIPPPKCDCPPPLAANDHPWPKGYQDPVSTPRGENPAPVVKTSPKAPVPVKKAPPKPSVVKPKDPACAKVPAAAYQHPVDVVLFAAERRQISAADMATLKTCITRPR